MTDLQPVPEHRFTFGLPTRRATALPVEPSDVVYGLADVGAWGIAASDDELVAPAATSHERDSLASKLRAALGSTGMVVSAIATDLSRDPAFAEGALTAAVGGVRRYALGKTMRALDLGMELGAVLHLLRCGYERTSAPAARASSDALDRYREAIDFLCGYARDNDYPVTLALMPGGPNADVLLATIGEALAFIETLEHPGMVGLSPRPSAEPVAGLARRGVDHAIGSGRLAQIDLSAARAGGDLGFGSTSLKDTFLLVKLLEDSGFLGPRFFGAAACLGDGRRGVWDFAAGCMRTYRAMAAKATRFGEDPDIQEALADAGAVGLAEPTVGPYTRQDAEKLAAEAFDSDALAAGNDHQRLDQLITDLLIGLR